MSALAGRELLTELYKAAVAAAATGRVTATAADALRIERDRPIWVFAIGKAAHAMAGAAIATLQRSLHSIAGGVIVGTEPGGSPCPTVPALRGDHPVPGRNSFAAAARIAELSSRMKSTDRAVVLVSGGASSLVAAPVRGLGESDLSDLFETLLGSGLDIVSMNAVRKRFSQWGGGRLALALAPATTHCLIVSDVIGDDPSSIGSGPCVPDPFFVRDVIGILDKADLMARLPRAFQEHLADVARGVVPETPKVTHPAFAHVSVRVIGNNRVALDAAASRARELGVRFVEVSAVPLHGNAAERGAELARDLLALHDRTAGGSGPACKIWGGETTVALRPPSAGAPGVQRESGSSTMTTRATGGRCQELVLAVAQALDHAGDRAAGITLLAAGTDGRDGPTDAAGAFADASTWAAIRASGRDPEAALAYHDSYAALDSVHALLRSGPTGTNVMDVVIGCVG